MPSRIQAKFISQQPQKHGYWLIKIELSNFMDLNIGSRFAWQGNQAWLFQKQHTELHLLATQDWDLEPQEAVVLEYRHFDLVWSAKSDQLWLGSDLSQAAVFDAAKRWQQAPHPKGRFSALLHASDAFAFQPHPARFMFNLSPQAIGASPLLEDYGIANRLASDPGLPGCHDGSLAELYQAWLLQKDSTQWQVFGFLPKAMHQACFELSKTCQNLDFQVRAY
jgi:hypothetical protein